MALEKKMDFLCILDQDSMFSSNDIKKSKEYIIENFNKEIGMYVPEIIYSHKEQPFIQRNEIIVSEECEWAISSGSFMSLKACKAVGKFDENYFIDRVDYDYCYELRKKHYKILMLRGVYLYQNLGTERKVLGKTYSEHSAVRHYYMFRNRLYFYWKNRERESLWVVKITAKSIRHIVDVLLYESDKINKLIYLKKGLQDFCQRKMGKFQA